MLCSNSVHLLVPQWQLHLLLLPIGAWQLNREGASVKDSHIHQRSAKGAGQQQWQQNTLTVTHRGHQLAGRLTKPDASNQQAR